MSSREHVGESGGMLSEIFSPEAQRSDRNAPNLKPAVSPKAV